MRKACPALDYHFLHAITIIIIFFFFFPSAHYPRIFHADAYFVVRACKEKLRPKRNRCKCTNNLGWEVAGGEIGKIRSEYGKKKRRYLNENMPKTTRTIRLYFHIVEYFFFIFFIKGNLQTVYIIIHRVKGLREFMTWRHPRRGRVRRHYFRLKPRGLFVRRWLRHSLEDHVAIYVWVDGADYQVMYGGITLDMRA